MAWWRALDVAETSVRHQLPSLEAPGATRQPSDNASGLGSASSMAAASAIHSRLFVSAVSSSASTVCHCASALHTVDDLRAPSQILMTLFRRF
jgi:hypothetical protein